MATKQQEKTNATTEDKNSQANKATEAEARKGERQDATSSGPARKDATGKTEKTEPKKTKRSQEEVYQALLANGSIIRADLCKALGLDDKIVHELIESVRKGFQGGYKLPNMNPGNMLPVVYSLIMANDDTFEKSSRKPVFEYALPETETRTAWTGKIDLVQAITVTIHALAPEIDHVSNLKDAGDFVRTYHNVPTRENVAASHELKS